MSYDASLGFEPKLSEPKSLVLPLHKEAIVERIVGIEPTSPTWKEGVITIIRYPLLVGQIGIEPITSAL